MIGLLVEADPVHVECQNRLVYRGFVELIIDCDGYGNTSKYRWNHLHLHTHRNELGTHQNKEKFLTLLLVICGGEPVSYDNNLATLHHILIPSRGSGTILLCILWSVSRSGKYLET